MSQNFHIQSDLQRDDLYCSFLEHLPIAAAMLDREMKYLLTSQRWLSEIGLEEQDIIGRSHLEVFQQFCEPLTEAYHYCLRSALGLCLEEEFQQFDGLTGWRQWTLLPWCNSAGVTNGVMLLAEDITHRKQAELALRREHKQAEEAMFRLAAIVESSEDAIMSKTLDSVILSWNYGAETLFGYTAKEAIGQSVTILIPSDRMNEETQIIEKLKRGERVSHFETVRQRKDGTLIDISLSISPVKDATGKIIAASTIARDIGARKQAEEAMFRLAAIVESSEDAIISKTLDGLIVSWNRGAETLFGYTAKEAIGQPMVMLVPGDRINEEAQILEKLKCGERVDHFETVRQRKDGKLIDISLTISPVKDATSKIIGASKIARDIGVRKQAEEALRHSEAQLRQKAIDLETTLLELKRTQTQLVQNEKMSSLGQLVAGIAHEINNPVNFIYANFNPANEYIQDLLGLLQLYKQHYPSPVAEIQNKSKAIDLDFLVEDLPKLLCSMEVGADRIKKIVLSLRNFSRMDEAEMKSVNIHEGIDNTLMILQNRLKAKQDRPEIEVIKEYGNLPLVECYAGQLNQVFMNIISNAIDALEERDEWRTFEEMKQQPSQIRICTEIVSPDRIKIGILDNGCGIPESVQQRLCDPFFTTKPVGKGTGLGMSISYQIVTEKHGGSLQWHSIPGQGADFVVEIPIQQSKQIGPQLRKTHLY
ncbi:PAS domain S-box protein [Calothrix sp. NIES-2098]|uniref:PAS domain S-box protein n=1 Tax=Calothrix sp. NIES-2098 TaxID=1954171 RepID=UPI000B60DF9B|nr:PAS/PAC sensor signal transduction histidine kinase [Calothrix sp. NIES-2098]